MTNLMPDPPLPAFARPPVAEVGLAIQFVRPLPLRSVDLAAVRQAFEDEFPGLQEHLPAAPIPAPDAEVSVSVELMDGIPLPRLWMLSADETQLVQFQPDRLGVNWRLSDHTAYPHYDNIRPLLEVSWERLRGVLGSLDMSVPDADVCEAVYVNPIEVADPTEAAEGLSEILAPWSGATSDAFLPPPRDIRISSRYTLPSHGGLLTIDAYPAQRVPDLKPILLLQLSARGRANPQTFAGALEFLDLAHEWIVQGFADFTTAQMHERWGRER